MSATTKRLTASTGHTKAWDYLSYPRDDMKGITGTALTPVIEVSFGPQTDAVDHDSSVRAFSAYLADEGSGSIAAKELRNARQRFASRLVGGKDPTKQLGRVTLKALRLAQGLSQSELAGLLGTSQSRIARIEGGKEDLGMSFGRRLAGVLRIDMNALSDALEAIRAKDA